ncbi:Ig-like domain-containing protein [Rhodopseudomonas sp. RCAM05734]|uniref:Ig-like domain-containing protein n=1 Tax=Rhodopseudomonas sp. RCAM05734 TaxID=3457549 RepID=UPI004043E56C
MALFPDATNTGVPAGVTLTPSGDLIINTPGAVIQNLDIKGQVIINAANVTLLNCKIASNAFDVVLIKEGVTGAVIKNCDIDGLGSGGQGIGGQGTFVANNIHDCADGIDVRGDNTVIQDNFIHNMRGTPDSHFDGIQADGGFSNLVIQHNTVINEEGQTSAIMLDNYWGAINNVLIDNNLLIGGGYTVYINEMLNQGGAVTNVTYSNNHVGNGYWGDLNLVTQLGNQPKMSGNVSDGATIVAGLTMDGQPPASTGQTPGTPVISSFSNDSGVQGDGITNDNTVTLNGTAVPNSTIKILDSTKQIGTSTADASGNWTFSSSALTDGSHKFSATATTSAGTSASSVARTVVIDTAAPVAPTMAVSTSAAALASSHVAVLTGNAEANSTVKVFDGATQIGTATVGSNGAWTFTTGNLATGSHSFIARAMDAAGNTGNASAAVPVTISTPTTPKPDAPTVTSFSNDSGTKGDGITNDNTITLTGTAAANSTVKISDGSTQMGSVKADSSGSWSYITSVLTDAKHTLTATATNSSGQTSAASSAVAITIDTKAPGAPTIAAVGSVSAATAASAQSTSIASGTTVNLKGTAEAKSSVAIYEGATKIGNVTAGTDGVWSFSTDSLSAGQHTLTAKATDVAGNAGATSAAVKVSVSAPTPTPPAAPKIASFSNDTGKAGDGITSDNTLKLDGTAAGNVKVTIYDGVQKLGTVMSDGSGAWSFTTAAVSDGSHNLTAKATDSAGQTGAASSVTKVTIDTHAPNAPTLGVFSSDGKALSGSTTVDDFLLKGTAEANSLVKLYDAGKLVGSANTKSDGTWSFDTGHLSDGDHKYAAIASDLAGNASAASATKAISVIDPPASSEGIDLTKVYQGSNNSFVIKGTADAYSQIKIFDASKEIGTVKAHADGNWCFGTGAVSPSYVHTFSAKELDNSGHVVSTSGSAIVGTYGANTLKGTSGDDIFTGNGHPDTFVFTPNFGNDTIKDFQASGSAHDVVQFSKSMFDNFADILSHATQSAQDVVITSGHDTLTLKNTQLGALDRSDFHFA